MNIQGREYCQVVERLKHFHENHKDGIIKTSYEIINGGIMFTAQIFIGGKVKATGHGFKGMKQEFNVEKCETRAIGRALGIFGIGADGSISSYDEVAEATGVNNESA